MKLVSFLQFIDCSFLHSFFLSFFLSLFSYVPLDVQTCSFCSLFMMLVILYLCGLLKHVCLSLLPLCFQPFILSFPFCMCCFDLWTLLLPYIINSSVKSSTHFLLRALMMGQCVLASLTSQIKSANGISSSNAWQLENSSKHCKTHRFMPPT